MLFALVCLLLAAGGWAQEPPPSAPPQRPPISPPEASDASEQQSPERGGPAILSRGGMATVAKATLQCRLGYDRMSSLAQTIGRYRSYSGGGGTTVKLSRTISLIGQVDGRHYDANGTMLRRSILHASPGLSWSPGERPLAIW